MFSGTRSRHHGFSYNNTHYTSGEKADGASLRVSIRAHNLRHPSSHEHARLRVLMFPVFLVL